MQRSGATDKFEQSKYLTRVRKNYEQLVEYQPERFLQVDATRSPEEVLESVEEVLEAILEAE
jgi:dTMP kinase